MSVYVENWCENEHVRLSIYKLFLEWTSTCIFFSVYKVVQE